MCSDWGFSASGPNFLYVCPRTSSYSTLSSSQDSNSAILTLVVWLEPLVAVKNGVNEAKLLLKAVP